MKSLEEILSVLEYNLNENEDATKKVLSEYKEMQPSMPSVDDVKHELDMLIKNNYNLSKTIKHVRKAIKTHTRIV